MRHRGIIISVFILVFILLFIEPVFKRNTFIISFNGHCFAEEWKEFRSAHFIINYKKTSNDFLYKMRDFLEEYYQGILQDLGFRRSEFWTWENRAKIYIFDSHQDYIKATGMSDWSAANVDYYNKIINTYPEAPNLFENVLVHELTHIIFREYVGFGSNIPLWLDEGVAMFMEKKKEIYLLERELNSLDAASSLFSLRELSEVNAAVSFPQGKAKAFYIQSFSLVYFLIKQFGRDAFAKFCYMLKQAKTFENCLWYSFDIKGLDDFQAKWRHYFFD